MDTTIERLIRALADNDRDALPQLLSESAVLRIWDAEGVGAHRPAEFVSDELWALREGWVPETLQLLHAIETGDTGAGDFRIQLRRGPEYFDFNAAVMLGLEGGAITTADFYIGKLMPAMARHGIVPASLNADERRAFIEAFPNRWDLRESFPPNMRYRRTAENSLVWTKLAHPGSNYVRLTKWSDEEADDRIKELMDWYRAKGLGMQWTVGPFDSPADLGERLQRHGFVRAGDQALMARFGLEHLDDIPTNAEIEVIPLKEAPHLWEDSLQINATAFQWPYEQTENEREGWFEDLESEPIRSVMALVDGKPVADAHLYLQSGVAYLGGAATLPEYRNRKIYSTLLRRRLEIARNEGYEVAVIHAEPMSRRVVSRFGFETHAMYDVYGWMDPMDLDVIKTLIQDQ